MVARQLRRRGSRTSACSRRWAACRASSSSATTRDRAYDDAPLSIGYGQTISQPYMVALIAEVAAVRRATGCSTSARAPATRPRSSPSSAPTPTPIERIPELAEQARAEPRGRRVRAGRRPCRRRLARAAGTAPFDAIAVAAAAPEFPRRSTSSSPRAGGWSCRSAAPRASASRSWSEAPKAPPSSVRAVPLRPARRRPGLQLPLGAHLAPTNLRAWPTTPRRAPRARAGPSL